MSQELENPFGGETLFHENAALGNFENCSMSVQDLLEKAQFVLLNVNYEDLKLHSIYFPQQLKSRSTTVAEALAETAAVAAEAARSRELAGTVV